MLLGENRTISNGIFTLVFYGPPAPEGKPCSPPSAPPSCCGDVTSPARRAQIAAQIAARRDAGPFRPAEHRQRHGKRPLVADVLPHNRIAPLIAEHVARRKLPLRLIRLLQRRAGVDEPVIRRDIDARGAQLADQHAHRLLDFAHRGFARGEHVAVAFARAVDHILMR